VRPIPVVLPAGILLLVLATPAHAAKGESTLSVSLAFNSFSLNQDPDPNVDADGGLLQVEYERGLTDTLWLHAAAGGGVYDQDIYSLNGTAGLTFALDVLKYIPYLNLGVGTAWLDGGPINGGFRNYLELGFGLEVLSSRTFSYGFNVRYDSFASDLSYLSIGGRVTWRWGFF
jgi:hypothetical protein